MKSIIPLLVNYGPYTITAGIALIYLAKDWQSFKKRFLRLALLLLILLLCIAGIFNTYFTNVANEALKASIETANKNQKDNTEQFVTAFGKLSQKLSDLQTDVKTADLREEVNKLKAELVSTQKALKPPKAELAFTFVKENANNGEGSVIREITLPVKDNVIHVKYKMLNKTNVVAQKLELILQICRECEFASEPSQSTKFPGQPNTQRNILANGVYPLSTSQIMSADIKVPPNASSVEFGVDYRCETCEIQDVKANTGVIKLAR